MPFHLSFLKGRKLPGAVFLAAGLLTVIHLNASAKDAIQRLSEDDVKVVKKVAPQYPAIARQLNLTGKVVIDLTVAEDGGVDKADVVMGSPILGAAAADAGKHWKFAPIKTEAGVRPIVRVNFNFSR